MKTDIKQIKELLDKTNDIKELDKKLEDTHIETKSIYLNVEQTEDEGRIFKAIATDSDIVDSDFEVVLSSGCDYTSRYIKNPVILYEHDLSKPIGKCIYLQKNENNIVIEAEIAKKPDWYEGEYLADRVWADITNGILKAVSIRYLPVDWRYPNSNDFQKYGKSVKRIITKYILLEISVTSLPANSNTLIIDKNNSKNLKEEEVKEEASVYKVEKKNIDYKSMIKKEVEKELAKRKGKLFI